MKEKSRIRITNYHGKFFYRLIDSIFIRDSAANSGINYLIESTE